MTAFSSAFTASVLVGCVAALLQVALGHPLAWSLADSRLTTMSAVLALALPLVGAAGPVQGLLTRERAYQETGVAHIDRPGTGHAGRRRQCSDGCRRLGVGGAAGGHLRCRRPCAAAALPDAAAPRCQPGQHLRELLRVGLPLTASTLVQHGRYRLFALLIGGTAGAAALGQVHMAFRLVDAVRELAFTAQWRLMLPLAVGAAE